MIYNIQYNMLWSLKDIFGTSLLRFCRLIRLVRIVKVFRLKFMKLGKKKSLLSL